MRALRRLWLTLVVAALLIAAPASAASPPASQSCNGQIVALVDQASGATGPSSSSQAATGPGYFLGPQTSSAVRDLRAQICS